MGRAGFCGVTAVVVGRGWPAPLLRRVGLGVPGVVPGCSVTAGLVVRAVLALLGRMARRVAGSAGLAVPVVWVGLAGLVGCCMAVAVRAGSGVWAGSGVSGVPVWRVWPLPRSVRPAARVVTAVLVVAAVPGVPGGLVVGARSCLGRPARTVMVVPAGWVVLPGRLAPWPRVKNISWDVLPLVAGLFVMVAALDRTGLVVGLSGWLRQAGGAAVWASGLGLGVLVNLVNNLPAGLLAGHALALAQFSPKVSAAALVGVDLGPNLSVTGSLATILWLTALKRAGLHVTAWQFLRIGLVVMPPALLAAVAVVWLYP